MWSWLGDGDVWEWIRTLAAGLGGALIGGLFSIFGQSAQAKLERAAQKEQFDFQRDAAVSQWEREKAAAARANSIENAMKLMSNFVTLRQEIEAAPIKKVEAKVGGMPWEEWWRLWDAQSEREYDTMALLLTDDATRLAVRRLVSLISKAEYLTAGYNPEAIGRNTKDLVLELSSTGIELMGSYIRDTELDTAHENMLAELDAAWLAYGEYEDWSLQQTIELARAAGQIE
jgi:hypothetical protein